jgi:hypothetical protein
MYDNSNGKEYVFENITDVVDEPVLLGYLIRQR